MTRCIEIVFEKYHGLGNDFIVTYGRSLPSALPPLAKAISNRHTGVGADGFVVVLPARNEKRQARLRFFNADGSEAEMSGNGLRCAAAFLANRRQRKRPLAMETPAGVKTAHPIQIKNGKWVFRVGMGEPILAPAKIPFEAGNFGSPVIGFPLRTRRGVLRVSVTSMGNPHCTVFVGNFARTDWIGLGREIENNRLFPHRTNVEFVKVISRKEIEARFWERGVGETASSGTGACGAVVACILNGLTNLKVRVRTRAGVLDVAWLKSGEISLTGPVERIARGTFYYREAGPGFGVRTRPASCKG